MDKDAPKLVQLLTHVAMLKREVIGSYKTMSALQRRELKKKLDDLTSHVVLYRADKR